MVCWFSSDPKRRCDLFFTDQSGSADPKYLWGPLVFGFIAQRPLLISSVRDCRTSPCLLLMVEMFRIRKICIS
uniref:Uncharacterized protein n=1 Tax=Anguilla anguilla TaxID=7936 RepID=A0A0E9WTU4_ANGAN